MENSNTMNTSFYSTPLEQSNKVVVLEPTQTTPFVQYINANRSLKISGNSFIDNASQFYSPFMDKIYEDLLYAENAELELHFQSFCPRTARVLFALFDNLRTFKQTGKSVNVVWKSDTDNLGMYDLGNSFAELFDLDIQLQSAV